MYSLKQKQFLIIYVMCMVVAGCSLGNLFLPHKGKTGHEDDSLRDEEISATSYRVQIGLFDTMDEAEQYAESARARIEHPVYLEYIPPFYRVRVGNFIRKSDAEECVEVLKQKGFRDSRYVFKSMDSE